MSERFLRWMTEAWPGYLIVGILAMAGSASWFGPSMVIVFGILGCILGIIGRSIQYIGYDFSAPDND